MAKINLTRYDQADPEYKTVCGTFIGTRPHASNVHLVDIEWRPEGMITGSKWILGVDPQALETIEPEDIPGMSKPWKILFPSDGKTNKGLQKLRFGSVELTKKLREKTENADATKAALEISNKLQSKTQEELVNLAVDSTKKIRDASGSGGMPFMGRKREGLVI